MHDSSCGCPDCLEFHPDRFSRIGEPVAVDLKPGERAQGTFVIRWPEGDSEFAIKLEADCGCGGKMIPDPRRPLEWICDRQRWWKPWEKHAHLKGHIGCHNE